MVPRLQREQQHHGCDQPDHRPGLERGDEGRQCAGRATQQHVPRHHARQQRQHHVEHGRQQQRLPRHGDVGHAEQQRGDGREGEDHHQIVHRHLHQCVVGVALHQLAPDEDHRRAGGHAEQDHAGDVLGGRRRIDPGRVQVLEEEHAQRGHREGLDQPVDDQRQRQALRPATDLPNGRPVDLDHHRIDHHPDEQRNDQVDMRELQRRDGLEDAGHPQAQAHAGADAQGDPEAEVTLEQAHRRGQGGAGLTPCELSSRLTLPSPPTARRAARGCNRRQRRAASRETPECRPACGTAPRRCPAGR